MDGMNEDLLRYDPQDQLRTLPLRLVMQIKINLADGQARQRTLRLLACFSDPDRLRCALA